MHQSGRSETIASIRDLPQAGEPRHALDRRERPAPQVVAVDADEPLLGRPEDHRLLASPAVRVAVRERKLVVQVPRLAQARHDHGVRREHVLAAEPLGGLVGELAARVDRAERRELIRPARLIIFRTVAGRGVDQPGPVVDAHVSREHDATRPVGERVPILGVLKLSPLDPAEHGMLVIPRSPITLSTRSTAMIVSTTRPVGGQRTGRPRNRGRDARRSRRSPAGSRAWSSRSSGARNRHPSPSCGACPRRPGS